MSMKYVVWDPKVILVELHINFRVATKGIINSCSLLPIGKKTLYDSESLVVQTVDSIWLKYLYN